MKQPSGVSYQVSETRKKRTSLSLLTAESRKPTAGFTLIEMLVAVALFSVVMLVTTGALLSLVDANRKAQALHSVMENLNVAVDGMIRGLRMGSSFHCGEIGVMTVPTDCTANGGEFIAYEAYGGDPNNSSDQQAYRFSQDAEGIGRLYKTIDGGANYHPVTAKEVNLTSVIFFVSGSTVQDTEQPRVIVLLKGTAGSEKVKTETSFTIQATASQRALDL